MIQQAKVNVNEELKRIWAKCRDRGTIIDDLDIIEFVARCMAYPKESFFKGWENRDIFPEVADELRERIMPDIEQAVQKVQGEQTAQKVRGKQRLFDEYLLFYPAYTDKHRFPTPRHIANYMRSLVNIKEDNTLCDLACGSGGLLVSRVESETLPKKIVGFERDEQWAIFARINLLLHNDGRYEEDDLKINTGDVFEKWTRNSWRMEFDRILLAPPFGDNALTREQQHYLSRLIGYDVGSTNEAAFVALTLHTLAVGGRAAILVSGGFLTNKNTGPTNLRTELVGTLDIQDHWHGRHTLDAIIALPEKALQPYGTKPAYLLLVNRKDAQPSAPPPESIWFFRAETDGYPPSNRKSVLMTQYPQTPNDLTLIEEILSPRGQLATEVKSHGSKETAQVKISQLKYNDRLLGITLELEQGISLSSVEEYPAHEKILGALVICASANETQHPLYIGIIQEQELRIESHKDKPSLLNSMYPLTDKPTPPSTNTLPENKHRQGIAIRIQNLELQIIGVAIAPQGVVAEPSYNLQPDHYLPRSIKITLKDAASSLGDIRHHQQQMLQRVDSLLGRLEISPVVGEAFPEQALSSDGINILTSLSDPQKEVWQQIGTVSRQHARWNGVFTFEDLAKNSEASETEIHLTIELLERLGLIVPVTIVNPQTRKAIGTTFYRRVTDRDIWK